MRAILTALFFLSIIVPFSWGYDVRVDPRVGGVEGDITQLQADAVTNIVAGTNITVQRSGGIVTVNSSAMAGDSVTNTVTREFTQPRIEYLGAAEYTGKNGVTNSEAPVGTYHNLFVQATTNGAINHAIVAHTGEQSESNRVGALHVYANTAGGTALHILKVSKSPTGGGELELFDADGNLVIEADADAGEIDLIGAVVATSDGGSGVTPNTAADSFVVDSGSLNSGISITSTNGGNANIMFGTLNKGNNAATVQYVSSVDRLRLKVGNVTKVEVLTTGASLLGQPTATNNADAATEIVNYRTATNLIETLAPAGGGFFDWSTNAAVSTVEMATHPINWTFGSTNWAMKVYATNIVFVETTDSVTNSFYIK